MSANLCTGMPQVIEQVQKERLAYISHISHEKKRYDVDKQWSNKVRWDDQETQRIVLLCAFPLQIRHNIVVAPWLPIVYLILLGLYGDQRIMPRTLVGKNANHLTNPTGKANVKFSKDLCLSTMLLFFFVLPL